MKGVVEALCAANPGMKSGAAEDIISPFWGIPPGAKGSVEYKRIA